MGDLSKNFSAAEFVCPCRKCDGGRMNMAFIEKLQKLRDLYAKPLTLISGYRCVAHNKAEGGAPASLHLLGRAVDFIVPSDRDRYLLIHLAISVGLRGIGVNNGSLHVDDRDQGAIWTYYKKH